MASQSLEQTAGDPVFVHDGPLLNATQDQVLKSKFAALAPIASDAITALIEAAKELICLEPTFTPQQEPLSYWSVGEVCIFTILIMFFVLSELFC